MDREECKGHLKNISHSSKNDFISCRYKLLYHKLNHINIRPHKMPNPLKLGSIWDNFLEHMWNKKLYVPKLDFDKYQLYPDNQAKLSALMRAFEDLGLSNESDKFVECQSKIEVNINGVDVLGYMDRKYANYFVESKLSSRPDNYNNAHNIRSQLSTYFLADPSMEKCLMEVTRLPQLRQGKAESIEDFESRVYSDIIRRPKYYFLNLNRDAGRWGWWFHRSEFKLDEMRQTYNIVIDDILNCIEHDLWYRNYASCNDYGSPCIYLPICEMNGYVSDEVYYIGDNSKDNNVLFRPVL